MHHRLIAILAILCFAFGGAGCESLFPTSKPKTSKKKRQKDYQLVVMPLQTGSTLQRHAFVEVKPDSDKPKKKSKKKESPSPTPKPEAEPSETPPPAPEETPAPTPERFR